MRIAFCLFKYFPYGGLQRDFLRIAQACQSRGHEIHVYTMGWEGELPAGFHLHRVLAQGWQNHARYRSYASKVASHLASEHYDVVMGFNKIPGLDIYYAADVCYQSRAREKHHFLYRALPRYRQFVALEKSIFARGKPTEILLIADAQQQQFIHWYQTEPERFHLLPPGIAKDRIASDNTANLRTQLRLRHGLEDQDRLLLMIGSGFKTKGLDRILRGLAFLPNELKKRTQLLVIGQDDPRPFQKMALSLQVNKQVYFLGGRDDVPLFLQAADLLVHPAYHENTGTVLLEAIIAGLPVLTVDTCGYAHYVNEANAGLVLSSPYDQAEFNTALQNMLLSPKWTEWQQNGMKFGQNADIYHLPEKAVDIIENYVIRKRVSGS